MYDPPLCSNRIESQMARSPPHRFLCTRLPEHITLQSPHATTRPHYMVSSEKARLVSDQRLHLCGTFCCSVDSYYLFVRKQSVSARIFKHPNVNIRILDHRNCHVGLDLSAKKCQSVALQLALALVGYGARRCQRWSLARANVRPVGATRRKLNAQTKGLFPQAPFLLLCVCGG